MAKTAHQRHAFNVSQLPSLARKIEQLTAEGTHFALILFDQALVGQEIVRRKGDTPSVSTGGYTTYIGNAERASMIAALRECASNLERNIDISGAMPDLARPN